MDHQARELWHHAYAVLQTRPDGLTRSQISHVLQHNRPAEQIQRALDALLLAGRATPTKTPTAGRPAELWTATTPPAA